MAVVVSIAFSIAVILCTIGLMDGFENTLKHHLRSSSGEINLYQADNFFDWNPSEFKILNQELGLVSTPVLQVEGFGILENTSKGLLIKGVDSRSFTKVTGLKLDLHKGEVAIGIELAQEFKMKVGDEIALSMMGDSKKSLGAPVVKLFKVTQIVQHGIYEKDLRFVYVDRQDLSHTVGRNNKAINMVALSSLKKRSSAELVEVSELIQERFEGFETRVYWEEFHSLLKAVEVEKFSIGVILQIIVIVAVFNLIAFIIFIFERKSQEFFLLRAFGLSIKKIIIFWMMTALVVWGVACSLSIIMAQILNILLTSTSFIELPGDVYVLSKLSLLLDPSDYFMVFSLALVWILAITGLALIRMKRKTIIHGLRQEFA